MREEDEEDEVREKELAWAEDFLAAEEFLFDADFGDFRGERPMVENGEEVKRKKV